MDPKPVKIRLKSSLQGSEELFEYEGFCRLKGSMYCITYTDRSDASLTRVRIDAGQGGMTLHRQGSISTRMQYDPETKCYWLASLVKQGGYDYQYWFVPKSQISNNKTTTTQRVDGSYWQTENEYAVYVYWRPFGARYDRLVGVSFLR
jgi:hypothetical protein